MTGTGGYYAVLDVRAALQTGDFDPRGLPSPRILARGAWAATSSGGSFETLAGRDGERCLLFHGTIHNRAELRRQLGLPSHAATEQLLFWAWARWPKDWTSRLDGLYAIAYWTGDGSDLTLRRDASGMLGLFYARTALGGLALSSRLDTLMRLPGVTRRLARNGLHEYLCLLDIAAPNTIYEGVRAVPAGEGVILDALRPEVETVLPAPAPAGIKASFEAALDELQGHLTASIHRRLDQVPRPAAFLSGGIDSSLLCALGARQRPDLGTLTVGFDLPGFDETPIARRIASHLGLHHQVLRFKREEVLRALTEAGRLAEQPMADPAEPVTLLAFERARQDYDAVLDGTGADEQMGAMPPRHIRLGVAYASYLPRSLRRLAVAALKQMPRLAGHAPLFDFAHPAALLMRWKGFTREEIRALCGTPVDLGRTRFFETFSRFPRGAHYDRYSALMGIMPSDRLGQAMLMTGLDVRFPFYSPEVDAYARGLPQDYRWQENEPKRILRALLARHVPPHLWDVPKHGFNFPLIEFLSADDFEVVRRYLLPGHWLDWQVLAPEGVGDYAHRFIAGEQGLAFKVWALVVLAAWLEGHFA